MRIVLVTYGSEGDSRPVLALAWGLQEAGHEVSVLADENASEIAATLGIEFHALAGSMREAMATGRHGINRVLERGRGQTRALTRIARVHTCEWSDQIDAEAGGADAILGTGLALLPALAVAEIRGVPSIAAGFQPYAGTREFPPPLSGLVNTPTWLNRPLGKLLEAVVWNTYRLPINQWRKSRGRPARRRMWDDYPALCAWSPTLQDAPDDWHWGPGYAITGDWRLPADHPSVGSSSFAPDPKLAAFLAAGEPPIYVGFGSMVGFGQEDRVRRTLLDAFAGRRILLSAGWADLTATELPDGVHPIGRVPHGWLFPQCAAVLHHCGAGTTHTAARAGVPTIPVPIAADQPFWAERLRRLGIASRPVDRHRLTVAGVREALAEVDRPEMRERGAEVATRMAGEDGVGAAVRAIEHYVAHPRSGGAALG